MASFTFTSVKGEKTSLANTSNVLKPTCHPWENRSHSFNWGMICTKKSFYELRILEGLMMQLLQPSLNRQINSETTPVGNDLRI